MKNKWTNRIGKYWLLMLSVLIVNEMSAQINIDFATTSPTCNSYTNGTATANPSGGTAPYQYFWSNGQAGQTSFNLTGGDYSVTVSDAVGMTATAMTTVSEPALLEVEVTADGDVCLGTEGSWSATVSGGTSPYFYQWSNGMITPSVNNLSPGYLSVTVTDSNGCKAINGRTVNLPLSVEVITTDVVCFGLCDASATSVLTGGVGPFTYLWNTGSTEPSLPMIPAGDFSVTVTDADGCVAVGTGTVNEPPAIMLDATITGQCTDDAAISVTASGGTPPLEYFWNTGATSSSISNLSAGTYSVTVTDANNCKVDSAFVISAGVEIEIADVINPTCIGGNNGTVSVSVIAGEAPFTYLWSNGGMTQMITALDAGTYSVTVTDAAGCTATDNVTLTATSVLSLELSSTPANCDGTGGTATVDNVINGTAPFMYEWSTNPVQTTQTAGNLAAGTYNVTVTDAAGCTATNSITVTATTVLSLELSSTPADCDGTGGTATVDNVINGIAPFMYEWSTNPVQTTQTAENLAAATYSVTVTDAAGCTVTDSITLISISDLTLELSSTPANCDDTGGTATVDNVINGVAPFTYEWSTNPVQTTQTAENLAAGFYDVTVTDADMCDAFGTIEVEADDPLTILLQIENSDCNNSDNGQIMIVQVGPSVVPPLTYMWSHDMDLNEDTATNLPPGIYGVTVTDATGCTGSADDLEVGANSSIESDIIWEVDTCMGDSILVTFSENSILTPANATIISWDWNFDDGTVSTDPTVQFYTTSDSIMAELIVVNSANCRDTVTELIVFNLLCDLYPDTIPVCENEELIIMPDANCTGIATYEWLPNPAIVDGGNTASPTIMTDTSVLLMVNLTNDLGCSLMEEVFIQVIDTSKQIVEDEIMTTQCDSTTIDFSINNPDIDCYYWIFDYPNSDNTGNGQNTSYTYPEPGIYTLAIVPSLPCLDTIFKEILVSEPPSADFTVDVAPCTDMVDISLMDASLVAGGITDWDWTLSNGDTSDLQNPTFTFESCQVIDAQLIISFETGCQDTAMTSFEVPVFENPPNLEDTIIVCATGDTIFLNPNPNLDFDYSWTPANMVDDPNSPNPMVIVNGSSTFSVVISDDGCADTCSVTQNVEVILSEPLNLMVPDSISVCEDTEMDLEATTSAPATFIWATNADFNPYLDSIGILASSTISFEITDTTTIYTQATDEFGCVEIDSFLVANYEVLAEPEDFVNVCINDTLEMVPITNLTDVDNVTWMPDNPNGTAPVESGTFTIQIVNNNGCMLEQEVEINVQDVTADLNIIPRLDTILLGDEVRITALSDDDFEYNWSPESSLDDPNSASPTASPTTSTTYELSVIDTVTQCRGMGSSQICVVNNLCDDPLIFVPNTFTPNGDGLNDVFFVRGFNIDEVQMIVYNRWGQKVFETRQVDKGWDGSYEGGVAPPDVYGYYLRVRCISGGEYEKKGNVTVIR